MKFCATDLSRINFTIYFIYYKINIFLLKKVSFIIRYVKLNGEPVERFI